MARKKRNIEHIFIKEPPKREPFTSTRRGGGIKFRERDPRTHSVRLLKQLKTIQEVTVKGEALLPLERGSILEFSSYKNLDLDFEALENKPKKVRLLSVREEEGVTSATVFVPEGQLEFFSEKIKAFKTKKTPKGSPKHNPLVSSISKIRPGSLKSLWTDDVAFFPKNDLPIWWEVWWMSDSTEHSEVMEYCKKHVIRHVDVILKFPERFVTMLKSTPNQMQFLVTNFGTVSELRGTYPTPWEHLEAPIDVIKSKIDDLLSRTTFTNSTSPAVSILDTGVTRAHPLIEPALKSEDIHEVVSDIIPEVKDHGTGMAGLSLYGDLMEVLNSSAPLEITHSLESVAIGPSKSKTEPKFYGPITESAVYTVELTDAEKKRVFCLAVTTTDQKHMGKPTSWSASIDRLSYGREDDPKRLFIISAGNTDLNGLDPAGDYHDICQITGVFCPGQSWNALTIGAYTEKTSIAEPDLKGWKPVAPAGELSPHSSTSLIWQQKWPIKPDIVLEGGNRAVSPNKTELLTPASLMMLSTHDKPTERLLTSFNATSGATALASRMAAQILSIYPNAWPETVRGLLIHSANWTEPMIQRFPGRSKQEIENRLRCYGYGVPDIQKAIWSAKNLLTLVAENEILPFSTSVSKSFNEMHLYNLPWPKETLLDLGEMTVKLRVTLSYFIEPNPPRRGYRIKYRYQSFGLRFTVNLPEENMEEFNKRVNKEKREEGEGFTGSSDAEKWTLGPKLRTSGSVHSDIWEGSAAELSSCNVIGIYPTGGWWKNIKEKQSQKARYSLIVSLETEEKTVDIYTPVKTMIAIKT